jgi:hypothetical protein
MRQVKVFSKVQVASAEELQTKATKFLENGDNKQPAFDRCSTQHATSFSSSSMD